MRPFLVLISVFVLSLGGSARAQETIGPWMIEAVPSSATGSGPVQAGGWLNVVNSPVTIQDAFTSFSILDAGLGNLGESFVLELTFADPVMNGEGPDLVLFDARFDAGAFAVSTEFDGFGTELPVTAFIDSGEDRLYFFEFNQPGPFPADVFGAEIDLSDLGLAPNDAVSVIRVRSTNDQTDPLGLGSLQPAAPPVSFAEVPTLGSFGLGAFVLLLLAGSIWRMRKRPRQS